ncbi:MAG: hypothetical protein LAT55_07815 [Opitutales bacterium]|nr:hypothetical protein [Opitutales bacterium]
MTNQALPPIILCNTSTILEFLEAQAGTLGLPSQAVFIELGRKPFLALRCGYETPPNFPGIAGALASGTSLKDFSILSSSSAHPVVFAPGMGVSATALADGLESLAGKDESSAVPVLPLHEVSSLLGLLEKPWPLHLFWDINSPPRSEEQWLSTLLEYLSREDGGHQWQGLTLYEGTNRIDPASFRMLSPETIALLKDLRLAPKLAEKSLHEARP